MLNQHFSSSSSKKKKKDSTHSPRNPLRDVNGTCSSSSVSIEAKRGCLAFFLSNSSVSKTETPPRNHKSLFKTTPKSAPNAKPSRSSNLSSSRSRKPLKENQPKPKKKTPCLYQWQSGKKPNSKMAPKSKSSSCNGLAVNLASGSEELSRNSKDLNQKSQKQCYANVVVDESSESKNLLNLPDLSKNFTPVVKLECKSEELSQNLKDLNQKRQKQYAANVVVDESGESKKVLNLPDSSTGGLVENSTPVGKLAGGSVLGCEFYDTSTATTTQTPPVQASVSPEIQCGSSILVSSATPACYGAGHIVSGVADRRKCRARGILAAGEADSSCGKANIFDHTDEELPTLSESRMSLIPLPVEASMRWLLSPCVEEDEDRKSDPENELHCPQKTGGITNLGNGFSPDLCNILGNSSSTSPSSKTRAGIILLSPSRKPALQDVPGASFCQVAGCSSSVSPHVRPTCEPIISQEHRKHRYDLSGDNSPFSIDSLGSGNVIQTPQSDLSSDRHVGMPWLNAHDHQKHDFASEIDSVTEVPLRASLSPTTKMSIWDSPSLNFQLSDLISPSNSIDLTQLLNTWDNRASCISNSTLEDMSRSQMRISWRDGLASQIFEMDEFDCCRCLSDNENNVDECSNSKFKSSSSNELNDGGMGNLTTSSDGFGSREGVGQETMSQEEGKEKFPPERSNPCAESICTDGGGLVASGDSDWTLCYKNQLFEI
ncbi:Protein DEK like [Actinidia chinensis var. chinensis]|uniref:Protein DEK like n=1 Tax=Actinidia chinensis var. chinensis TaxID=1590841 RepID=A0A2R6RXU9_ACTCC|nr:Protein DEK like [Actinidia chinensis var. chinensis]